jgi:hypothetical protein
MENQPNSLLEMSERIKSEGLTRAIQQIVGTLRVGGNLAYSLDIIAKDISFEMQIKGIFAEIKFIHTDLYFYSYFGSGNQSDNADGGFNSYGRCHIIKHVNVNLFSVFPDDSDVYGSVH